MSYLSDYANNVSQILLHRGDAQAQAALNRGKIWGTALSQIGETIGGIPAARQLQKDNELKRADQAQQRELTGLQMTRAQAQLGDDQLAREKSKKDQAKIEQLDAFRAKTLGATSAEVEQLIQSMPVDIQAAARDTLTTVRNSAMENAKKLAKFVQSTGYNPEAAMHAAALAGKDEMLRFLKVTNMGENDDAIRQYVDGIASYGEKPDEYTLGVGDTRWRGSNKIASGDPVTPKELTFGTTPVRMMVNGKPVTLRTGSDGFMYDLKGQRVEDENISMPEPTTGTSPRVLTPNAESQLINRLASQWNTAAGMSRELERQVKIMDEGLKASERGDLAQGGQAVLVTFQKILDPTSVVRESEFDRSREGQSLMQRAQGAVERLVQGGPGVPLSELKKYAELARAIAAAQVNGRLPTIKERIGKNADRYSIPRELVFETDAPSLDSKDRVTVPQNVADALKGQPDGPYTLSDGSKWVVVNGVVKGGG